MSLICPACNFNTDQKYLYCPMCSAKLQAPESNRTEAPVQESARREVLVCPLCGDDNEVSATVCAGCGGKINHEKAKTEWRSVQPAIAKQSEKKKSGTSASPRQQDKKAGQKPANAPANDVPWNYVAGTAVVTAGVVLLVLLIAGVFDKAAPVMQQGTGTVQNNMMESDHNHSHGGTDHALQLEKQLSQSPDDVALTLQTANAFYDAGVEAHGDTLLFRKAIQYYEQYLVKDPKNTNVLVDLGTVYFYVNDFNSATTIIGKALAIDPNHVNGHLNMGIVKLNSGDAAGAKVYFQKVITLAPNTEVARHAQSLINQH